MFTKKKSSYRNHITLAQKAVLCISFRICRIFTYKVLFFFFEDIISFSKFCPTYSLQLLKGGLWTKQKRTHFAITPCQSFFSVSDCWLSLIHGPRWKAKHLNSAYSVGRFASQGMPLVMIVALSSEWHRFYVLRYRDKFFLPAKSKNIFWVNKNPLVCFLEHALYDKFPFSFASFDVCSIWERVWGAPVLLLQFYRNSSSYC